MLIFLISSLSFLLLLSKPHPLKPILPTWAKELWLVFILLCKESVCHSVDWLKNCRLVSTQVFRIPCIMATTKQYAPVTENVEETEEINLLDLPELALECILEKLSPAGLCNMAGVCKSLRDRCRSDLLWERHMREKWGRVLGRAARREWQLYVASLRRSSSSVVGSARPKDWMSSLACAWPFSLIKSRIDSGSKPRNPLPVDSMMSWYLALKSGKLWFPAQVYNRENGNVGFLLSCYDAEVSYDCCTDTFQARYPPHGRRAINIEEEVQWHRLRAPPVDIPAHELHISDSLNELCPGDHIEIQWRRNKEFPYGWWYGVIGHLESCDGNEQYCHCHNTDTVILEFNQYTLGSRWRRTAINRKNHREEGNETDGFYGGIRKVQSKDEIATWRQLWPTDILE